jgi:inorganic pyrophosphatase
LKLPATYSKNNKYLWVVIETPSGSRNKYTFDEKSGLFRLKKTLPAGMQFPCDMGFLPRTRGEDGDPLDVLILMDDITYPGCLVECRLLGVITAEQTDPHGKTIRNDRFICVPQVMKEYNHLREIEDINPNKMDGIVSFFENYNRKEKKKFKMLGLLDSREAHKILTNYRNKSEKQGSI